MKESALQAFFSQTFIGENTLRDWCWFLGILLTGLLLRGLVARLLTGFLFRVIRRKDSEAVGSQKLFELLRRPWNLFLLLITLYIAFHQISYPKAWKLAPDTVFGLRMVVIRLFETAIAFSITWFLLRFVDFFGLMMSWRASLSHSKTDDQLIPFFKESIKIIIAILSIFTVLGTVYHVNIASLIAGLGIGGLAVALAAKESLENLIGSFTVFLDKPFVIGDHVRVGAVEGVVEKIGFRSSRIRTLENSFVTVPNRRMVELEVDNLSRRTSRRALFTIGLSQATPTATLRAIISDIQQLLDGDNRLLRDENRARFLEFSPNALNVQVTFFVLDTDALHYVNVREEINFRIMEIVALHGGSYANPTQPAVPAAK